MLPILRSGFGEASVSQAEKNAVDVVLGLLRLFARDALEVSVRYSRVYNRKSVSDRDMIMALQYCARVFFEKSDLDAKLRMEIEQMRQEDSEEGEEGEDEDGEEGEEGEDEDGEEGEEGEEGEDEDGEESEGGEEGEEGEDGEEGEIYEVSDADRALARHVETIDSTWQLWQPEDEVQELIRRSIEHARASAPRQ